MPAPENVHPFENMSYTKLLAEAMKEELSAEDRLVLNRCMRDCIRQQDAKLKKDVQKEKDDTVETRAKLKASKDKMAEARKTMTAAFAQMNAQLIAKSCVKHFVEFEEKANAYIAQSQLFNVALNEFSAVAKTLSKE